MKTVHMTIDVEDLRGKPRGRIDAARVDGTTEDDLARHLAEDTAEAVQDAAKYAGEGGYCTGLNRTDRVVVARRTR